VLVEMPDCCVCLGNDTQDPNWGCWPCGHVMHINCIGKMFFGQQYEWNLDDHRKRDNSSGRRSCPMCKKACRFSEVVKLYFEYNDDDLSEDDDQMNVGSLKEQMLRYKNKVASLKSHLAMRDNERTAMNTNVKTLNATLTTTMMELKDVKLQLETLKEQKKNKDNAIKCLMEEKKMLENKAANLEVTVEQERKSLAKQRLALDIGLMGNSLRRQIVNYGDSKMGWVHDALELRNKMIADLTKKLEHSEKDRALIQKSKDELLQEHENLKQKFMKQNVGATQSFRRAHSVHQNRNPNVTAGASRQPIWDDDILGCSVAPAVGSVLGKRKSHEEEEIVILDDSDDSEAQEAGIVGQKPLMPVRNSHVLSRAGPSKVAMKTAPGPSFIKKSDLATTGLEEDGKFINRRPDGKGGWRNVYSTQQRPVTKNRLTSQSMGRNISTFFKR
jgi:hypothetical protein